MTTPRPFVIATRGSRLALWQAEHVRQCLQKLCPGSDITVNVIKTRGDIILDVPLSRVGGKGLFVKEIEETLLNGKADLAVHSIKDVPAVLPDGLTLSCVPAREDCSDCLLSVLYDNVDALPQGACVGTSSLRRQAQLLHRRPDLRIESLRGNVDTRLRKLQNNEFDAIILASAGLKRLNLSAPQMCRLDPEQFLPAAGQGALGIECRESDSHLRNLLSSLEDRPTRLCVEAERGFLAGLGGGCQTPVATYADMPDNTTLRLIGLLSEVDGSTVLRDTALGYATCARKLGLQLAETLLNKGGREILDRLYQLQ